MKAFMPLSLLPLLPVSSVVTVLLSITDTYALDSSTPSIPVSSTAPTTLPSSTVTTGTTRLDPVMTSSPNDASSPFLYNTATPTHSTEITTASPALSTSQMLSATPSDSPGSTTLELPQEMNSTMTFSSSGTSNTNSGVTDPIKRCESKSCGEDASCVNLNSHYICLCMEGYYYNSGACLRGKTFPGLISVQVNDASDLQNEGSLAYENLWNEIITFFQSAFAHTDYKQTVIHTVSTSSPQARTVTVRVVNIFEQNTTEHEASVTAKINNEIRNSTNILAYSEQTQCDYYGCDDVHQDNCSNSLNCQCKDGLQRPFLHSPFCLALQCSEDCNTKNKKQCLKDSAGRMVCACLPGYRKTDNNNCQACPFGYTGMECEDQFQLILTIVGTILGVLVLSLVIALVISVRSSNKNKDTEEQNLMENDFQNLRLQHTDFGLQGPKGSLFPEVKTGPSRSYQASNPYVEQ